MKAEMKVDNDYPIPKPFKPSGTPFKYPFNRMKPGQSFAISGTAEDVHRLRSAASKYGRKHGLFFSVRKIGQGCARCWMVE